MNESGQKKYILWDHDGVLVNTEEWFFRANMKALGEIGLSMSVEEYMRYMQSGISVWEMAREKVRDAEIIAAQRAKRNQYYQEFLIKEDIEIPEAEKVLKELKQSFRMAIITTSRRSDFDLIHKNRNITAYMEFCLANGEYKRSKPHPDPYLEGMARFRAKPEECIVVEDSARGLKSAVAAGIDCIIIKHEFTKTHDFSGAKYMVDDITGVRDILLEK